MIVYMCDARMVMAERSVSQWKVQSVVNASDLGALEAVGRMMHSSKIYHVRNLDPEHACIAV